MGLLGGDDGEEEYNERDDSANPYPEREPDFRARSLFDLEDTRKLLGAVHRNAKHAGSSDYDSPRIEEPKDRSFDSVQTEEDGITDATIIWPIDSIYDKDMAGEHIPPEDYVWTHMYGREQPTGEMATEMYTFDHSSEGTNAFFITSALEDAEKEFKQQSGDAIVAGGGNTRRGSRTTPTNSKNQLDEEIPVGEAYDPEGYSWEDLGATDQKINQLKRALQYPLEEGMDSVFEFTGVDPDGVLLYGPPGTGKTLTTKIAATQADANVIQVSGADLFGELMGQSEGNMKQLYETAREISPTVILMDEIDQVAQSRGNSTNSSVDRVVGQMLQELDGYDPNENILTVGTTNRPDMIDNAITRRGRLGNDIEMDKPSLDARRDILEIQTKTDPDGEGTLVEPDLDYNKLAEETDGFTGADIQEALEIASNRNISSIREQVNSPSEIEIENVEDDLRVSEEEIGEIIQDLSEEGKEDEPGRTGFH